MSLDVVIASTDPALTTMSAVKDALGITTTSDDARISDMILRVSEWANGIVGYPLAAAKYREAVAGYGTRNLMLSRTPIRSVSALFYGTDTGEASQVESSEFGLDREAGFLTRTEGWEWTVPVEQGYELHPRAGQEYQPWMADYVAGYTFGLSTTSALWSTEKGTTSTGRTLPYDIEDAVIRKVASVYTGNDGVYSKQVGDLRIVYGTGVRGGGWISDPSVDILRRYARSA